MTSQEYYKGKRMKYYICESSICIAKTSVNNKIFMNKIV